MKFGYNLGLWWPLPLSTSLVVRTLPRSPPSCPTAMSKWQMGRQAEFPGQSLDNPKPMGQGDEFSLHPALATPSCHTHLLTIPQI